MRLPSKDNLEARIEALEIVVARLHSGNDENALNDTHKIYRDSADAFSQVEDPYVLIFNMAEQCAMEAQSAIHQQEGDEAVQPRPFATVQDD